VLFARIGAPHCPLCDTKIEKMTTDEMYEQIVKKIKKHAGKDELVILSPVVRGRKGEYYQMLYDLYNSGYLEVRVDGKFKSLRERLLLSKNDKHDIAVVVDRISLSDGLTTEVEKRLSEAVENAVDLANGLCIAIFPDKEEIIFSTEYSCPKDGFSFPEIEPRLFSFNSPYGYCEYCTGLGTKGLFSEEVCPKCNGKRLNENALNVRVGGKNIWEVVSLNIRNVREFFAELEMELPSRDQEIAGAVLKEIQNRLQFMYDVGLHYLTLNRTAGTLSGGEAQRIRLASQVGTRLVGALYVLDEPTIGLHQKDNDQLVKTLRNLCDVGNTIIVVEHDEDTILASDWVVDFGPGAGKHGGEIIYSGPRISLLSKNKASNPVCQVLGSAEKSLTGKYLRRELKIATPEKRRKVDNTTPKLKVKGATEHNLKNITVEIPLRRFVCLTGVSGSVKVL